MKAARKKAAGAEAEVKVCTVVCNRIILFNDIVSLTGQFICIMEKSKIWTATLATTAWSRRGSRPRTRRARELVAEKLLPGPRRLLLGTRKTAKNKKAKRNRAPACWLLLRSCVGHAALLFGFLACPERLEPSACAELAGIAMVAPVVESMKIVPALLYLDSQQIEVVGLTGYGGFNKQ